MRSTVALIVAIAFTLGFAGGAVAQGTGTQGPGASTGQGSGTAPGAKSAGDPSKPPTSGDKIPPVSVNPGAPVTAGSDAAKTDSRSDSGSTPGTAGFQIGTSTPKSP